MPIIDILGGVTGGSSGSGSTGSTSTIGNGLSSLVNSVLPGLGGILNNILAGLSCLGSQAFKKEDYEIRVNECAQIVNSVVANPSNLEMVKGQFNHLMYVIFRDQITLSRLSSSCSRQWCDKTIQYCKRVEESIEPFYTYTHYTKTYNDVNVGQFSVQEYHITGYKGGLENNTPPPPPSYPPVTYPPTTPPVTTTPTSYPPVTYPPTTPPVVTPPVNYPPVTYPDTTPYYPPVTYPDTTTPPVYNPPVTGNTSNSSGGITRTQTVHSDGSMTIYLWNPDGTLFKTTNIPAPNVGSSSMTSNLDGNIDINGNIGDWNFGLNNNKDQTLYIAGGLGLLGLIAFMAKSKK